jgi:hypothetical protein
MTTPTDPAPPPNRRRVLLAVLAFLLPLLAAAGYLLVTANPAVKPRSTPSPKVPPEPGEATNEQVRQACAGCHAYPPPETFPRFAWRKEVKQGYDFLFKDPAQRVNLPPLDSIVRYYEKRAPETLPSLPASISGDPPLDFRRDGYPLPSPTAAPGVANVCLAPLFGDKRPDLIACDALGEQVLVLSPYKTSPQWQVVAKGLCAAHAEVIDLNGDGIQDILLACLGNFFAMDDRVGSVVWLKGNKDQTFTPVTLLEGVGRVADVRAADFNKDGKLDLIVAVFGWRNTGEIICLENRTTDWAKPAFARRVVDPRRGTVHVPVCDLNGDGWPDFVALISQEHETVVAFLNDTQGGFRKETIWTAPHPAFGCSGIEVLDLDGDKDLDVLLTNGDALDAPYLLKPYHGVHWLENQGGFPFHAHRLTGLYGAGRAVAADFDSDGDLDVIATSFLPAEFYAAERQGKLDSVILLEQTSRGKFRPHLLESAHCDHATCAVGDVDGDGLPDLVVGNFLTIQPGAEAVVIWKNLGKPKEKKLKKSFPFLLP